MLTSQEAYAAKLKHQQDKNKRKHDKCKRKSLRDLKSVEQKMLKLEKLKAAEKRKADHLFNQMLTKTVSKSQVTEIAAASTSTSEQSEPALPDEQTCQLKPLIDVAVGSYVVFDFEGQLFPGKVVIINKRAFARQAQPIYCAR